MVKKNLENHVAQFEDQVNNKLEIFHEEQNSVKDQISMINNKLLNIDGDQIIKKNRPSSLNRIDIALMYSEPLVISDPGGLISLGDPVDYEEECNKLLEILNRKEKRIEAYFEIATIENLLNVLSLSPKILHIICHGEINKEKDKFYLCFVENSELRELYISDLKEKISEMDLET